MGNPFTNKKFDGLTGRVIGVDIDYADLEIRTLRALLEDIYRKERSLFEQIKELHLSEKFLKQPAPNNRQERRKLDSIKRSPKRQEAIKKHPNNDQRKSWEQNVSHSTKRKPPAR